jgi:hypothetical protein
MSQLTDLRSATDTLGWLEQVIIYVLTYVRLSHLVDQNHSIMAHGLRAKSFTASQIGHQ